MADVDREIGELRADVRNIKETVTKLEGIISAINVQLNEILRWRAMVIGLATAAGAIAGFVWQIVTSYFKPHP